MKYIFALFLLLYNTASAAPIKGLHDYGVLSSQEFEHVCRSLETEYGNIYIHAHKDIVCEDINVWLLQASKELNAYIYKRFNTIKNNKKIINIYIINLSELNNPNNFSQTDRQCMYNFKCMSGAFFGRTFYSLTSKNINMYIVNGHYTGNYMIYSFETTFKHELLHAILHIYGLNYNLTDTEEHKIISDCLKWIQNK